MAKVAMFVDGSNLYGMLNGMNLRVAQYGDFYQFLFQRCSEDWARVTCCPADSARLQRVYWYVVGSIDEWDLSNPKSQQTLRDIFERDRDFHRPYLEEAGRDLNVRGGAPAPRDDVMLEAWARAFKEMAEWFDARKNHLSGLRGFYHGVRSTTDLIDLVEAGHWKVDFFRKVTVEKGLDASLAVDMVAFAHQYDVAVVVSGDADMLPSIRYCKSLGKHVGVVEFLRGHPPEDRGRGFSSKLRVEADFVTQVYEMELALKDFTIDRGPQGAQQRSS